VKQSEIADLDDVTIVIVRVATKGVADIIERLKRLPFVKSVRDSNN
jgi:uncharacterized protein YlbG (UPF0298 family)